MFRKLAVLAILAVVLAAAYGAAANLGVSGGSIQAGVDASLYCDDDGVQVLGWGLETDSGLVNNVRIGGVAATCEGNLMFVRVEDGAGNKLGAGSVTLLGADPPSGYGFPFTAVDASRIEKIKVWIEGES